MPRKLTRKEKIAQQQLRGPAPSPRDELRTAHEGNRLRLLLGCVVALLGLLLYVNTLGHQYALDDQAVITENMITRRGWDGVFLTFTTSYLAGRPGVSGALYRPLSKATFAIEWGLAPDQPRLGHGVNVVLYALTGFLLFAMLGRYLQGQLLVPFVAAVLFIAHPLHTEAVANIKGRDELLCFLFFVLIALAVHRYATRGSVPALLLGSGAFFLALLSKESAITFLAVIPLMLFFFTDGPRSRVLVTLGALVPAAGLFLIIRQQVLGGITTPPVPMLDNYLATMTDVGTQTATAVFLMGVYLKLLFFPYPLISDGSYQHFPTATLSDWRFLLAFAVYAALAMYAILRFRKKDPVSFSILYFFITGSVVFNVLRIIGTNYGERLMYAPSLGFCLAIAALLVRVSRANESTATTAKLETFLRAHRGPLIAMALVVSVYGFETVARNADWYDSVTLSTRDSRRAPRSARLHYALGQHFLKEDDRLGAKGDRAARKELLTKAIAELNTAVEVYPEYASAIGSLGLAHQNLDDTASARMYFEKALHLQPDHPLVRNNLGTLLLTQGDIDGAITQYQLALRHDPDYVEARVNLGLAYARAGERSASAALEERKRNNDKGYRDHGSVAGRSFTEALFHLNWALGIVPENSTALLTAGAIYRYLGDEQNARDYLERAEQVKRRGGH